MTKLWLNLGPKSIRRLNFGYYFNLDSTLFPLLYGCALASRTGWLAAGSCLTVAWKAWDAQWDFCQLWNNEARNWKSCWNVTLCVVSSLFTATSSREPHSNRHWWKLLLSMNTCMHSQLLPTQLMFGMPQLGVSSSCQQQGSTQVLCASEIGKLNSISLARLSV